MIVRFLTAVPLSVCVQRSCEMSTEYPILAHTEACDLPAQHTADLRGSKVIQSG